MNSGKLEAYRQRLLELQNDLMNHDLLGKDSQEIVQLDQQATGRLSRMDALQHQAMAKAQQTRRNQMGQRIKAALARIDENEFGYCLDCGEDIGPSRLDADPTAFKCQSCAQGH